jgi:uncharacterized OsmC-like protein
VESDDGVLVIRRIHVTYHLRGAQGQQEVVERVHAMHHGYCPVYRTLSRCIDITTGVVEARP